MRKRVNKAPDPRFRPDVSDLLDPILGCPALALSEKHAARLVKEELACLDFTEAEGRYSSQGQHGFHPRHVFGALVYGSLIGIHQSTKLESALATDLALRFVAGGHAISAGRLRAFRRENFELYVRLQGQLLRLANQRGMLLTNELAVDSVRLRAHASTRSVRTMKRSRAQLLELSAVDVQALSDEDLQHHEARVERHRAAVALCEELQRPNVVLTSPGAGLMKFPTGASGPGHRATVVASGVKERFIVDVLIDSDATDFGKLGPAILRARDALKLAGVPLDKPMQVAGDAGYFSAEDLAFAANNRTWVDTLIAERSSRKSVGKDGASLFDVDDFKRDVSGKLTCPAQRSMNGPWKDGDAERWEGIGCPTCGLRTACTRGQTRTVTIDKEFHKVRDAMRARMAEPGARDRYNQRIATVEPVFSVLEDAMGFRRVTSRVENSVRAEVLLKVLAYNLKRLVDSKRVRAVNMLIHEEALSPSEDGT